MPDRPEVARLCLAALLLETMLQHGPRVARQMAARAGSRAQQAPESWPREVDGSSAVAALAMADEMLVEASKPFLSLDECDPADHRYDGGCKEVEADA